MVNVWVLISALFMSTMAYCDNTNIRLKGAIVEPACNIESELPDQCRISTEKNTTNDDIFNKRNNELTINNINDFILSYQSSKVKVELDPNQVNDKTVNLFIIYK